MVVVAMNAADGRSDAESSHDGVIWLSNHVRVFHPKPAGQLAISDMLLNAIVDAGIPRAITKPNYDSGWCSMHVVQYQKNESDGPNQGSPDYLIEISLFDNEGKPIVLLNCDNCGYTGRVVAPDGSTQSIESILPFPMNITVGAVDSDAILFSYDAQNWRSNDQEHRSNFRDYDSGKREGDTGFSS